MEAPDFVQPGTPEQRMIFQLLERVERLERAQDGVGARVEKGVPFAARDNGKGIIDAVKADRSFFVRLYLREEAWAAAVGDPASEDADDAPLVKLLGDDAAIGQALGRTVLKFDFVTHLHFERNDAVELWEKDMGRKVQVKVPVRCLEGLVTTASPAVTSDLLADVFERAWGDLLMEGGYREDLLDEDKTERFLFIATKISSVVEPCPHPDPVKDMMAFVGAKEPAAYRMYEYDSRWPVEWVGEEEATRLYQRSRDARRVMRVVNMWSPEISHPLVSERIRQG